MLSSLINSRKALKNNIQKRKFALLGLEEQYTPILNKLEEVKESIQSIELPNFGQDSGKLLEIEKAKEKDNMTTEERDLWTKIRNFSPTTKENGTLRLSEVRDKTRLYQLGDRSLALNNNLILESTDGVALKLNDGLIELFFKNQPDANIFTTEDVKDYKKFISDLGIRLNKATKKQRIISQGLNPSFGKGFSKHVVILPDDIVKLRQRLQVLLPSKIAGHNNVYNEGNEILKLLLEKKQITNEGYKDYLNILDS